MKQPVRAFIRVIWPGLMFGLVALGCMLSANSARSAQAQEAEPSCPECLIASEAALADIPPGFKIIEGDILVPLDFMPSREPRGDEPITQAPFVAPTQFWPGGVVPYVFSDNVTQISQTLMLDAMAEWEKVANVDFRLWNRDMSYLLIRHAAGNSSEVGWQGRRQDVNIADWGSRFVMVHELGHALGFWHEQSRKDRETYIRVHYENIESGQEHNFDLHTEANHYGPYDFESVMHYGPCFFSVNKTECNSSKGVISPTISLRPDYTSWQGKFGLLNRLSYMDKTIMSFIYPKPDWRFVDPAFAGNETGAFLTPYKQLATGLSNVPTGGTLWVQPGTYASTGLYNKPMAIQAPLGNVLLVR